MRAGPGGAEGDPPQRDRGRPPAWEPERWTVERGTGPAGAAGPAAGVPRRRSRTVARAVGREVGSAVEPRLAAKVERRLGQAADAFARDRAVDALRILRPLSREAPGVAAVRELTGLALYETGRWAAAARELEAFRALGGSVEQHPVLADCYRALGRFDEVAALWAELRAASPSAALVTEGRIVAAGARADRGDVRGAIRLLEAGPVRPGRGPAPHHLRLWYALADLYERAGDTPKARDLFSRVVDVDPGLADATERLEALG